MYFEQQIPEQPDSEEEPDLDGAPIEDLDGIPIDGLPFRDSAPCDLDGKPMDVDLDGDPLVPEDLDGMPCEYDQVKLNMLKLSTLLTLLVCVQKGKISYIVSILAN